MKNLIKISLAITLASFLITSCNKNKDADDQKEKAIAPAEMQNKANPFDVQGVLYNGFLNAMATDTSRFKEGGIMAADDWDAPKAIKDIGGWDVGKIAAYKW